MGLNHEKTAKFRETASLNWKKLQQIEENLFVSSV